MLIWNQEGKPMQILCFVVAAGLVVMGGQELGEHYKSQHLGVAAAAFGLALIALVTAVLMGGAS